MLKLPNNYLELEQEEMMYLDGGWSGEVFLKNLKGLAEEYFFAREVFNLISSQLMKYGPSMYVVLNKGYLFVSSKISFLVAKLGGILGGPVGAILSASGAGVAIWYLGENRVFY